MFENLKNVWPKIGRFLQCGSLQQFSSTAIRVVFCFLLTSLVKNAVIV